MARVPDGVVRILESKVDCSWGAKTAFLFFLFRFHREYNLVRVTSKALNLFRFLKSTKYNFILVTRPRCFMAMEAGTE